MSVSDPGHFLPNSATSSLSEGKKSSGRAVRWQKINHCLPGFEQKIILVCQDLNKIDPYVPGFEETNFRCGTCSCGRMCTSGRAWVVLEGSVVVRWVYRKSTTTPFNFPYVQLCFIGEPGRQRKWRRSLSWWDWQAAGEDMIMRITDILDEVNDHHDHDYDQDKNENVWGRG